MKQRIFFTIMALLGAMSVMGGEIIVADCDSIVTFSGNGTVSEKQVFLYDGDILSSSVFYSTDGNPSSKDVYEYTDGNLSATYSYYWSTTNETWSESSKEVFEYTDGNKSAAYYYSWEAGNWHTITKEEYYYDAQGKLQYDIFTAFWDNNRQYKYEYQYDEAGRLIFRYYYGWDSQSNSLKTSPSEKKEYQYDAQGYKIKEILYSNGDNGWGVSGETVYHNDAQGKMTSCEIYSWEQVYSFDMMYQTYYWGVFYDYTFEYDAQGRLKKENGYSNTFHYELGNGVELSSHRLSYSSTYYPRNQTGIKVVSLDNAKIIGYYSIMGQKLAAEPKSGVYIVKYDNGTAEKKLKKYRPF
jgi:hypothetical protein